MRLVRRLCKCRIYMDLLQKALIFVVRFKKCIGLMVILVMFYVVHMQLAKIRNIPVRSFVDRRLFHKIVHLDLKGAPPKLEYLKSILPIIQAAGATGFLIEYEDMFPFTGNLENISAYNAYPRNELRELLKNMNEMGFTIIPLVQTFGHMEYVLKLQQFRYLRENDTSPDSICPSKEQSYSLIYQIVKQIVEFHMEIHEIRWVHIGCDEVYRLNACSECKARKLTSENLFALHVKKVASYVADMAPNIAPIIWDDMLRYFSPADLKDSGLDKVVEIVVWNYSTVNTLPAKMWYQYTKMFRNIWIASSYKGAYGVAETVPNIAKHYGNNMDWIEYAKNFIPAGAVKPYKFRGIFLTGWSRYNHFKVPCETLPAAIPSLVLNLFLINEYLYNDIARNNYMLHINVFTLFKNLLSCSNLKHFTPVINANSNFTNFQRYLSSVQDSFSECLFPDGRYYFTMVNIKALQEETVELFRKCTFDDNIYLLFDGNRNIFSDPLYLHEAEVLRSQIRDISFHLKELLRKYFDNSTVNELMELKINVMRALLNKIIIMLKKNRKLDQLHWERRPYAKSIKYKLT